MVIVEKLVEWRMAGETKVLGENLPQRHFVHHKYHMNRPFFLFGLWGYWHCGHFWPIVPASGDNEDDYGEADGL
jgi:hypothetical protein